jgi:hypothetical protein
MNDGTDMDFFINQEEFQSCFVMSSVSFRFLMQCE